MLTVKNNGDSDDGPENTRAWTADQSGQPLALLALWELQEYGVRQRERIRRVSH